MATGLCRPARHGVSSPAWFAVVLGCAVSGRGSLFGAVVCAVAAPSRCPLSPPWLVRRRSCSLARSGRPLRKPPRHPPSRCVGAGTQVLRHCGVSAGTPAMPASAPAGLRQPLPRYPPRAPAGCRAGKASAIAPLAPACHECGAGGGCGAGGDHGAAGLVLMVLCLQAAPSPASRLSPSEEAQRRLERIFTASVIPGALALACCPPGDGDTWAACGCPGCAVCSARGDCGPVPGPQPHGPSPGGAGSRGRITRDAMDASGFGVAARTSVPGCGELRCPAAPAGGIPVAAQARLPVAGVMPRQCRGGCGCAWALWCVAVLLLLLLSASHPLSSPFSPPSSLPLAGPRHLRLGTQPGTIPPSSGALCLCRRPPAILCLPLGWCLCPRLMLERKAFPVPPCSVGCRVTHGAGGCRGGRACVPLPSGAVPGSWVSWEVPSAEVAWLGWARVRSRMERGRAPGIDRTRSSCWSSRGVQCWPGLQQVNMAVPNPGGFGGGASWLMSFPAPCVPSAALDLLLCWLPRLPSPGVTTGFAQRHFAPARFPPAAFCAVCGAEINPSRLHPSSLGLARVKRTMRRQPPLAPSLLQLRFGSGARPAPG